MEREFNNGLGTGFVCCRPEYCMVLGAQSDPRIELSITTKHRSWRNRGGRKGEWDKKEGEGGRGKGRKEGRDIGRKLM